MANGNKYTCSCCGTEYTYCPSCELKTPAFDKETFCSKKHADIFAILSKHGCHLATAEETLKALSAYNLDIENLTPSVRKHISAIKAEAKPVEEVKPVENQEQRQNFKPFNKEEKK